MRTEKEFSRISYFLTTIFLLVSVSMVILFIYSIFIGEFDPLWFIGGEWMFTIWRVYGDLYWLFLYILLLYVTWFSTAVGLSSELGSFFYFAIGLVNALVLLGVEMAITELFNYSDRIILICWFSSVFGLVGSTLPAYRITPTPKKYLTNINFGIASIIGTIAGSIVGAIAIIPLLLAWLILMVSNRWYTSHGIYDSWTSKVIWKLNKLSYDLKKLAKDNIEQEGKQEKEQ